jgi:hypothetical protein
MNFYNKIKECGVNVYLTISCWVLSPRFFFYLPWAIVPSTFYSKPISFIYPSFQYSFNIILQIAHYLGRNYYVHQQ